MSYHYQFIATPIGQMYAVADFKALYVLGFEDEVKGENIDAMASSNHPILDLTKQQLHEYFLKQRQTFDIPLALNGTPFQQEVWQTLMQIPYGQTISYKELAKRVFRDKAYRAAANANGKNAMPIIIPCHRVISSDGSIGGYSGGIARKQWLLSHEGIKI